MKAWGRPGSIKVYALRGDGYEEVHFLGLADCNPFDVVGVCAGWKRFRACEFRRGRWDIANWIACLCDEH
jgi:hypothetical protein